MSETQRLVTFESVNLKMSFSWQATVELQTPQKSTVFSHSFLPGVEWQLELHYSLGSGVAVYLVLVTNKHNFELPVKFWTDWAESVNGTMSRNRGQSKLRLPAAGFIKPPQSNQPNNQTGPLNGRFSFLGRGQVNAQPMQNIAQTMAVVSIDLKCYLEVSCPLIETLSDAAMNGEVGKLLTEGLKADVQFVVQGVKIPAHKLLLSTASPVFDRMFSDESKFEESRSNTVIVDDASAEAFKAFLRLVYTGNIDSNTLWRGDTALEVMSLGHKYQVDSILRRASHAIKYGLTIDTVLRAAEASRLFEDNELREVCASYIAQNNNFDEISKKAEWTSFIVQNASLVNDVMLKMQHRTREAYGLLQELKNSQGADSRYTT